MAESRPFVLLVCGSRTIRYYDDVVNAIELSGFPRPVQVMTGGQRSYDEYLFEHYGADFFAEVWAISRHIPCVVVEAQWKQYGKGAGFRRNEEMARMLAERQRQGFAVGVVGVLHPAAENKGTRSMLETARRYGFETYEHWVEA